MHASEHLREREIKRRGLELSKDFQKKRVKVERQMAKGYEKFEG